MKKERKMVNLLFFLDPSPHMYLKCFAFFCQHIIWLKLGFVVYFWLWDTENQSNFCTAVEVVSLNSCLVADNMTFSLCCKPCKVDNLQTFGSCYSFQYSIPELISVYF